VSSAAAFNSRTLAPPTLCIFVISTSKCICTQLEKPAGKPWPRRLPCTLLPITPSLVCWPYEPRRRVPATSKITPEPKTSVKIRWWAHLNSKMVRYSADSCHIACMAEYVLHINRQGSQPKCYSWEIYRAGNPLPIQKSVDRFRSPISAKVAGQIAIRLLLDTSR
jgi:hypothetical protein